MVALSRFNYPLASVAFFHALPGLERALRLHYQKVADPSIGLKDLMDCALRDGFVGDSIFAETPAFTPPFEKMVKGMLGKGSRSRSEAFVQLVPVLRNDYFHGTYLLAPDYLHLAFQIRKLADRLKTRPSRAP